MNQRRWRLSAAADADIADILRTTRRMFGAEQMMRYRQLLTRAADLAAEDPFRPASQASDHQMFGLRMLHAGAAAPRRSAAAHVLYYVVSDDQRDVLIVRVLHERMNPALHLGAADDEG